MESEIPPIVPLRLKIEINTHEHFSVFGVVERPFGIRSPWFEGKAAVKTYTLDELLATKLRALYQRRKGRDLFDLWLGLGTKGVSPRRIVEAFRRYMKVERKKVDRNTFEKNVAAKLESGAFSGDIRPLIAARIQYDAEAAARIVTDKLLRLL